MYHREYQFQIYKIEINHYKKQWLKSFLIILVLEFAPKLDLVIIYSYF